MYRIVGGDSKEYGPVSAERIVEWIAQGRATGASLVKQEDGPWKPLSTFPEFADPLRTAVPPPLAQGQPAPSPGAPVYPSPAEANNWAIAGLVLSILGVACCCGPLGSILGIVFSAIGLTQINQNPQRYTTSTTIAYVGIGLGVLGIVMQIIFYSTGMADDLLREFQREMERYR